MTFTAANPGGWALNEVLTSAQVNHLQNAIVNAVDGINGGTYALQSQLAFDGPADLVILGTLEIASGGLLNVPVGGDISLFGELTVNAAGDVLVDGTVSIRAPGVLEVLGSIEVLATGDINLQANGHLNVLGNGGIDVLNLGYIHLATGAELTMRSVTQLKLTTSATIAFRLSMQGIPSSPDGWQPHSPASWIQHDIIAAQDIMLPLGLLPGERLETLSVRITGGTGIGHGAVPAAPVSIELVSVDANGVTTTHATSTDPSGSAPAYDALHNIAFGAGLPLVVPSNPLYVRVIGEQGAGSIADTTELVSVSGTSTPFTFRAATEVH